MSYMTSSITDATLRDLSPFDLPGFNLPLNFIPGGETTSKESRRWVNGKDVFINALYNEDAGKV